MSTPEPILETERLLLRPIGPGDAELQFRTLNTPTIMGHLGGPLTLEAIAEKHAKSSDLFAREGFSFLFVIERETGELVPVIIHRIDLGIVRPMQVAAQLQVIGRVGKNQVDAAFGQRIHDLDAIARQNPVQRKRSRRRGAAFLGLRHLCLSGMPALAGLICGQDESQAIRRQFLF